MTQAFKQKNKDKNFIIRLANKHDMPQIINTQLKSLKILATNDYKPDELQALLASKNSQRSKFEIIFVAEIEQKIVGFAALDRYRNSLAGLFIDPDYTRQGIGTQLLQTIEREAIALRIPILWICASLTGHPFYLANNYQEIGQTRILLDSVSVPCIQMKKRLLYRTKSERIQVFLGRVLICSVVIWSVISAIVKL